MQIKSIDLSLLVKKVCDVDGVSVGKLKCGSRGSIVNARKVLYWLEVKEGHSGAEVARFLGVTISSCDLGGFIRQSAKNKKISLELCTLCTNVPHSTNLTKL
jgi:hypothetical protein